MPRVFVMIERDGKPINAIHINLRMMPPGSILLNIAKSIFVKNGHAMRDDDLRVINEDEYVSFKLAHNDVNVKPFITDYFLDSLHKLLEDSPDLTYSHG